MYFTYGHQQLVFVHSTSVSSQHNSPPAHERDVRTRWQQNLPGCV